MRALLLCLILAGCGGGEPQYPFPITATYAEHAQAGRIVSVDYPWLLFGRVIYPDTIIELCATSATTWDFQPCPQ